MSQQCEIVSQFCPEEPVIRRHRKIHLAQTRQRHFMQALADGIPNDERAHQRRAAHRRAEHHAQMRARMKLQAAEDECDGFHEAKLIQTDV